MVAMLIFPLNHFLLVQLTLVSSMKNTLKNLELVSNHNRPFLLDFLEYMREKGKVGIGSFFYFSRANHLRRHTINKRF